MDQIVDALIILGIIPADPDHEERTDDDARAIADVLRGCDYVCEYIATHPGLREPEE